MALYNTQPARLRNLAIALLAASLMASAPALAEPVVNGVPNFHQVNEHVYRGAQPSAEGFQNLSKIGVKTIIDLRESGSRSQAEEKVVTSAGMRYISVPMKGLTAPSDAQISKLLSLFDDASAGPVFVHCRRGADRTGTVCACYRIAHDHWENQKALVEARNLGMSWIERAMQHYVLGYHAAPVSASAGGLVPVTP